MKLVSFYNRFIFICSDQVMNRSPHNISLCSFIAFYKEKLWSPGINISLLYDVTWMRLRVVACRIAFKFMKENIYAIFTDIY